MERPRKRLKKAGATIEILPDGYQSEGSVVSGRPDDGPEKPRKRKKPQEDPLAMGGGAHGDDSMQGEAKWARCFREHEQRRRLAREMPGAYMDPYAVRCTTEDGHPTEAPMMAVGPHTERTRRYAAEAERMTHVQLMTMLRNWYSRPHEEVNRPDELCNAGGADLMDASTRCRVPPEVLRRELFRRRDNVRDYVKRTGQIPEDWDELGMSENPRDEQNFANDMDGICPMCTFMSMPGPATDSNDGGMERLATIIRTSVGQVCIDEWVLQAQLFYYRHIRPFIVVEAMRVNWTQEGIIEHVEKHAPTPDGTIAFAMHTLTFFLDKLSRSVVSEHVCDPGHVVVNPRTIGLTMRVQSALIDLARRRGR